MKYFFALIVILCLTKICCYGQGYAQFEQALRNSDSAVQAIHHYPKNIKDGECHEVPVTSITVQGATITITETWTNYLGKKATTVLTGELRNQVAKGTWKSSYSEGTWSYNFNTGSGTWNKTSAPLQFGTFKDFHQLEFRTVQRRKIFDGFKSCK